MTRDGGVGPDDYLTIVTNLGEVVVYAGVDPSDATNFTLAGVYQIGKPAGRNSFVSHGQQIVVMCEDDFYFIPADLDGKKQPTLAAADRSGLNLIPVYEEGANGVFVPSAGLIYFGDGTVLDTKRSFAYYNVRTNDFTAAQTRRALKLANSPLKRIASILGTYDDRVFSYSQIIPASASASVEYALYEINTPKGSVLQAASFIPIQAGRIRTGYINTPGRTIIHMVNPVFKARAKERTETYWSSSAPTNNRIRWRTAVVYDKGIEIDYSASANAWVTASASGDSEGVWTPGFGNGQAAQIFIDLLTCTASAEIFIDRIDITLSDTGGI